MTSPRLVLDFWFSEGTDTFRDAWFRKSDEFDDAVRVTLGNLSAAAAAGAHNDWVQTADGALALAILLDQAPRNLHRGSAQAFAADPLMRDLARDAILQRRHDLGLTPTQRIFLYLPFEHSEAMADQDLSVTLFEGLRDDPRQAKPGGTIDYAWRHRAVVARFGRFPHRNAALGRIDTPEEQHWLAAGGGF
ncbi:DUF924 domain-containing protein [Roseomonas sp. HJA6]|uniref:DUF924 domain-containing protein n=1 Tax=Roseomonas alba TaxID=2846776 RepID=A0ABS7A634_9PROT|nr:DUF924 family protein [Neoroseomonas alba]MBW6397766.1 DUF924 domain-containing protein [Neoroseomonas alba]